jgi:hypothetical protein
MNARTASIPAADFQRIAGLELTVEEVTIEHRRLERPGFARVTTEVILHGGGFEGRGEDTIYAAAPHDEWAGLAKTLPLRGARTVEGFSKHLDSLDLFPDPLPMPGMEPYRRWALESAALDLALRQNDMTLWDAMGGSPAPVNFALSMSLGDPPTSATPRGWVDALPGVELKIDASLKWDDALMEELAATGAVTVVDIKGHYTGDWIDNRPDPVLYERLARHFPNVLLEDAMLTAETREALGSAVSRLSWDAPIHSLADIASLDDPPAAINIKPSRFGTLERLYEALQYCLDNSIPLYGGGQYELGWGRTQIQTIAALWYPSASNDVAPSIFHTSTPGDKVPLSPLEIPENSGFGFATKSVG